MNGTGYAFGHLIGRLHTKPYLYQDGQFGKDIWLVDVVWTRYWVDPHYGHLRQREQLYSMRLPSNITESIRNYLTVGVTILAEGRPISYTHKAKGRVPRQGVVFEADRIYIAMHEAKLTRPGKEPSPTYGSEHFGGDPL